MNIRSAAVDDLESIVGIYNQAVPSKRSTGDLEPLDIEHQRAWFDEHDPDKCPVYVAEIDSTVAGYAVLSWYRGGRGAFRYTREISSYIDKDCQGLGVGSALFDFVLERCEVLGVKTLLTFIMAHNDQSVRMMEKYGFERWGFLPRVADFDGREFDHIIFGRRVRK